jgi:hypothetical protein
LVRLFNDILTTGKQPKLFKQAKMIAILKPEKDGTDASHYLAISLLSVVYKILERLILQRIQPLIEAAVPVSQAGFWKNRSCTEQVMALTSHIEAGFERKLKTRTIFIDLTAAHDTVWRDGLMLKFMRVISCSKISRLLNSRWQRLNNGLPQGSVLAPILFNPYMSDIPITVSNQFFFGKF